LKFLPVSRACLAETICATFLTGRVCRSRECETERPRIRLGATVVAHH
jgi:hypothetical protein